MTEEEYKIIDLIYINNKISNDMTVKEKKESLEIMSTTLNNDNLYYDVDVDGEITKYPCKLLNIDIFIPNNKTIFYIIPCVNNDCKNPIHVDKIYIKNTNDVAPVAPVPVAPVVDTDDDSDSDDNDFEENVNKFISQNKRGGKSKSRRSNKKKSNKKKKTNKKRTIKRKSNKKKRKTHRRR
jgi:hypothetical protein